MDRYSQVFSLCVIHVSGLLVSFVNIVDCPCHCTVDGKLIAFLFCMLASAVGKILYNASPDPCRTMHTVCIIKYGLD